MNDAANSAFETLVERSYPGAEIRIVDGISMQPTAPAHFCDDPGWPEILRKKRPDLLFVSPGYAEYFRRKTDRLRGMEFVVLQTAYGLDWRLPDVNDLSPIYREKAADTRASAHRLALVAQETGDAFCDLATPWHAYLYASNKPYQWFHRDKFHVNDRGRQFSARLLEQWFKPEC